MLCALDPAIEKMSASIGLTAGVVEFMLMVDEANVGRAKLMNQSSADVSDLQPAVEPEARHITETPSTIPLLIYESEKPETPVGSEG
jgi:hypothetical protein